MPTRPFDSSNLTSSAVPSLSRSLQMSSLAVPLPQPGVLGDSSLSPVDLEYPVHAVVDRRALTKGVSWALGIEGAAALCIYAVWHILRLVH